MPRGGCIGAAAATAAAAAAADLRLVQDRKALLLAYDGLVAACDAKVVQLFRCPPLHIRHAPPRRLVTGALPFMAHAAF
jgi:hypothetical protein